MHGNIIKYIFITAFKNWNENNSINNSAALSFYLLLSLPAIILFSVSIGSLFFGTVAVQNSIINYANGIADMNMIAVIKLLVSNMPQTQSISLNAIFSFILLIWSASNVFRQFKIYIDKTWKIAEVKDNFTKYFFKGTIISFITLILFGILITGSIIVETVLIASSEILAPYIPFINAIRYTTSVASFIMLVIFFIYIYRVLPEINIDIKAVTVGSVITSLLMTCVKNLIQIYLSYANLSIYSILESLIGLLMWIFLTAICITYSAEFTKIYADYLIKKKI